MKIKALLIGATAAVLAAVPAHAADLTLKFGHVGKPGSLFEASVDAFAACSNEARGVIVRGLGTRAMAQAPEIAVGP